MLVGRDLNRIDPVRQKFPPNQCLTSIQGNTAAEYQPTNIQLYREYQYPDCSGSTPAVGVLGSQFTRVGNTSWDVLGSPLEYRSLFQESV